MCREDHHQPPEPAEEAPFCDRCFGYHDWRAGCPEDFDQDEDDDDYPGPCTDPGGHEWPRVEEDERCLCVHCGADGDA